MKVSALYVMPDGPYPQLVEDWWDESRDAKLYDGPNPVVAHPPCGPWSKLLHMCTRQDPECGPRAVEQVRKWGGILEHPEYSRLWQECSLPIADGLSEDAWGGRTYYIEQVNWGHPCRKPTWLYVVNIDSYRVWDEILPAMNRRLEPTRCVCTGPGQKQRLPVAGKRAKKITPLALAECLVRLAGFA